MNNDQVNACKVLVHLIPSTIWQEDSTKSRLAGKLIISSLPWQLPSAYRERIMGINA